MYTLWKNEKFTVTEKKFRQINSLVTSLATVWKIALKRDHNYSGKSCNFSVKLKQTCL